MNKQGSQGRVAAKPEQQTFDLLNFKGMFFEQEHQKYTCPVTGAHFEVKDLCRRLTAIKATREKKKDEEEPAEATAQASKLAYTQQSDPPAKKPGERAPSLAKELYSDDPQKGMTYASGFLVKTQKQS